MKTKDFDSKMSDMGWDFLPTGGNCGGPGQDYSVMGEQFIVVLHKNFDHEPPNGFVQNGIEDKTWHLEFRDDRAAFVFAKKIRALLEKIVVLKCDNETIKQQLESIAPCTVVAED